MNLPVLVTPEFDVTIPSTQQEIKMRPFLVKEEKILLMAAEGKEIRDVVAATKTILQNCILSDVDVNKLAMFDIEYLFVKLRARSVGEIASLYVTHPNNQEDESLCHYYQPVEVNLDEIEVEFPADHSKKIMITDKIGIMMKYPTFEMSNKYSSSTSEKSATKILFKMFEQCTDYVFDDAQTYENYDANALAEWIETFTDSQMKNVLAFFDKQPSLAYTISYTCDGCKQHQVIDLKGLADFF